jgi:RiboL-PSP-HEPN
MDIRQVLQARANRRTRIERPFANFHEMVEQCIAAGELVLSGSIDSKVVTLLERSAVISTVTAIEVYYRDILDFIFRYCSPKFFEPHLKQLYPEKFDISDLLEVYRHQVHPLELVSAYQSFQNIDRIDKVFSRFLNKGGLWDNVLQLRVRVKDSPSTESSFTRDDLLALKRLFDLRHELVHDPARSAFFTEQTIADLWSATSMIFGSDIVLTQVIQANRDPELASKTDA